MFVHILNYCCKQDALKILAYKTIKFLILKHTRVYMCVEKGTSHQKRELPMEQRFSNTPTWEQSTTSQPRCCGRLQPCGRLPWAVAPPSAHERFQHILAFLLGRSSIPELQFYRDLLPQTRASMKYSTAVRRGITSVTGSDGELIADFSNTSPLSFPTHLQLFLL